MKKEYFIAADANIHGNVQLVEDSDTWFQSVLRGDNGTATVGEGSNIQDGTIIHVDEDASTIIGKYVTTGHRCILHGCKIGGGALIGMGSTALNNAIIGGSSLIGADSLVTEGRITPSDVLTFGRPAKVIHPLTAAEIISNRMNTLHYTQRVEEFRQ